jgi:hypothetical protein
MKNNLLRYSTAIGAIRAIRNPDKLAYIQRQLQAP